MPDPLTLSVMSQIVRKAGGKEEQTVPAQTESTHGAVHLTEGQAMLLSELIHKKKTVGTERLAKSEPGSLKTESRVSLDDLVRSTKTR